MWEYNALRPMSSIIVIIVVKLSLSLSTKSALSLGFALLRLHATGNKSNNDKYK